LETVQRAGFRDLGIDLAGEPQETWPSSEQLLQLARDLSRLGLRVVSLHTRIYPQEIRRAADPVQRALRIGRLNRGIDLLEALGGRIYVVDIGVKQGRALHGEALLDVMRTGKALARIGESCRKRGLALAIEAPLLPEEEEGSADKAPMDWLLKQFPSAHTGICLEVSSHASQASGIIPSLQRYARRILQIQINELPNPSIAPAEMEWKHCLDFFQRVDYQGAFMLAVAPSPDDETLAGSVDVAALNAKSLFPGWTAEP
jgi:sugar phosphate isomerase/epimerase